MNDQSVRQHIVFWNPCCCVELTWFKHRHIYIQSRCSWGWWCVRMIVWLKVWKLTWNSTYLCWRWCHYDALFQRRSAMPSSATSTCVASHASSMLLILNSPLYVMCTSERHGTPNYNSMLQIYVLCANITWTHTSSNVKLMPAVRWISTNAIQLRLLFADIDGSTTSMVVVPLTQRSGTSFPPCLPAIFDALPMSCGFLVCFMVSPWSPIFPTCICYGRRLFCLEFTGIMWHSWCALGFGDNIWPGSMLCVDRDIFCIWFANFSFAARACILLFRRSSGLQLLQEIVFIILRRNSRFGNLLRHWRLSIKDCATWSSSNSDTRTWTFNLSCRWKTSVRFFHCRWLFSKFGLLPFSLRRHNQDCTRFTTCHNLEFMVSVCSMNKFWLDQGINTTACLCWCWEALANPLLFFVPQQ